MSRQAIERARLLVVTATERLVKAKQDYKLVTPNGDGAAQVRQGKMRQLAAIGVAKRALQAEIRYLEQCLYGLARQEAKELGVTPHQLSSAYVYRSNVP